MWNSGVSMKHLPTRSTCLSCACTPKHPSPAPGAVHVANGQKLYLTLLGGLNDFITLCLIVQPHSLPIAKETK